MKLKLGVLMALAATLGAQEQVRAIRPPAAPLPAVAGGERVTCLGGWQWAVSAFSRQKAEAAKKAPTLDSHDKKPPESRIAVIGDSDFAANYALGIQGNSDMFMNVVNYLAQQENLIAIRPKPPADSRLTITAQQMRAISILSLVVVPALVFGTGVFTWWRRR